VNQYNTVKSQLNAEQAGFHHNRSTCYQVVALMIYIKNNFQAKLKTGAVFLDLTAAYDTGLLAKLFDCILAWVVQTV